MKKRMISLLLAVALALGLAAPVWAQSKRIVADVPDASLTLSPGQELEAAQKLNTLGLFQGVGTNADGTPDFDLDRTPTRVEGVVMLVRLLGRDKEGQKGGWTSPFTDVPAWASSYVGYAYNNQYTKGTSDTTFSPMLPLDAAQYLTLVLRAMDYTDGEDFQWDSPWTLSNQLGITAYDPAKPGTFTRGTAALWAWNALSAQTASGAWLVDRLVSDGALTAEQATAAGLPTGTVRISMRTLDLEIGSASSHNSEVLFIEGLPDGLTTRDFTWTSSNEEVVWLRETYGNSGITAEAKTAGTATITAVSPDGAAVLTCPVTVVDTTARIRFSSEYVADITDRQSLWVGESRTFTVQVDSLDSAFTMDDVEWQWDETRLDVQVSGSGERTRTVRITGLKEGDASLECYAGSSGGVLELHVNPAGPKQAIYIYGGVDGDVRDLEVGKRYTMSVINKQPVEGSDDYGPLTVKYWTLSDPSLADLDGGDLRPKAPGVLTITAVLADGRSLSTDVTIREQPPKPESMTFEGPDLPANFKEYDANGNLVYDVTINSISFRFHYGYWVLDITDCDFTINYLAPGVVEVPITYTLTNQNHEVADQGQLYFRLENGTEKWTYSSVNNLQDGNVYTVTLSN